MDVITKISLGWLLIVEKRAHIVNGRKLKIITSIQSFEFLPNAKIEELFGISSIVSVK